MRSFFSFCVFLLSFSVFARPNNIQSEQLAHQKAEMALVEIYTELQIRLSESSKESNQEILRRLVSAQADWSTFRQSECFLIETMGLSKHACLTKFALERAKILENIFQKTFSSNDTQEI